MRATGCALLLRLGHLGLIVLLALGTASCAALPEGNLSPVAAGVTGTSSVNMLVATTRLASPLPDVMFSGERGPLSFIDVAVSIPPDSSRKRGEIQMPKSLPGNPATEFVITKAKSIDQRQASALADIAAARTPRRRVLVFVHGFNNTFADSVFRFAQIVHDSAAPVVPVLFTWPSRGDVLDYGYDRESTDYSRDALETVLRTLAQDPQVREITILAHSMGTWLTLEALRQMSIRSGSLPPKIRNVVLAAPDINVDNFRRQMAAIGRHSANFTLLVSQDDRALQVSARLWGGPVRLGAIDAARDPSGGELAADGITVVDLTRSRAEGTLNHNKFASSPELGGLLGRRLVEDQHATETRVDASGLILDATINTAAFLGTVAGLVISAPAALVDPNSRSTYAQKSRSLGMALVDTTRSATQSVPAAGEVQAGR